MGETGVGTTVTLNGLEADEQYINASFLFDI